MNVKLALGRVGDGCTYVCNFGVERSAMTWGYSLCGGLLASGCMQLWKHVCEACFGSTSLVALMIGRSDNCFWAYAVCTYYSEHPVSCTNLFQWLHMKYHAYTGTLLEGSHMQHFPMSSKWNVPVQQYLRDHYPSELKNLARAPTHQFRGVTLRKFIPPTHPSVTVYCFYIFKN